MKQGWTVKAGAECWDEEFAGFLSEFLERLSPLAKIRGRREVRDLSEPRQCSLSRLFVSFASAKG
jgi:hypothetical protein